jgi:putative spermidine/putrescine transport system ATP-binding protein
MRSAEVETMGSDAAATGALSIHAVTKAYADVRAVDDVSLDVRPGEFLTLLGPSGSGKTTTLRIIAGFIRPDAGSVLLDGRDLTRVPPYKRDVGMVFQNYALFPHMRAAENLAFPLEMRGTPKDEIRQMVDEVLRLVRLEGLGDRYPRQLSGGQQQRVALARAIVFRPAVLLMDEPLGALDKKLREALQLEIIQLSRRLGVTSIYVTHDQEEALALSDRIAVYNHGRIEQLGTGEELYERPASLFVADFVGESNIFKGTLHANDGILATPSGTRIRVSDEELRRRGVTSEHAAVVVRPERMWIRPSTDDGTTGPGEAAALEGRIKEIIYLGSSRKYVVEIEGGQVVTIRARGERRASAPDGPEVVVGWPVDDGVIVPDEAGQAGSEADATPSPRR